MERLYAGNRAELVAVYGRRRIGKTYLIDEVFNGRIAFRHAGLSPVELAEHSDTRPLKQQLQAFYYALLYQGMERSHCPGDWLEAFFMLEMFLQSKDDGCRQVVFLDELPWMDTPRSGFITAFEGFWNGWGCHRKNLMVIVCGSATSWIADKLINNHGGLYGRVTCEIKLEPFCLRETEEFFSERGLHLSRYDLTQCYMIFGGIPYYLNYLQRGKSLAQNIESLFFQKGARFADEYDRLFRSIFTNPGTMKNIIRFLSTKSTGYTRQEILKVDNVTDGGTLTQSLKALLASDFIIKYVPFGSGKSECRYKLIDPFCLFYLRFIDNRKSLEDSFWTGSMESGAVSSWRGYAFENVCWNHIPQIKDALGIRGISSAQSPWFIRDQEKGFTQIDMVISRKDNVINLCEMKFLTSEFTVDRDYDRTLRRRKELASLCAPKKASIHHTLITTYGITKNEYRWDFENVILIDDLFS